MKRSRAPLLWSAMACLFAALLWAAVPTRPRAVNLAADLPPGALMTLECPDFSALLSSWNRSPQQKAWLRSANYSAFANSHLFGRLFDAQAGFSSAAHTDVDTSFLQQVAGRESIFAWYNIGNLEFLYLTHLSPQQATALSLVKQRSAFIRRETAGTAFYTRTQSAQADDNTTSADPSTPSGSPNTGPDTEPDAGPAQELDQPRTVAFALRGDWLLLATREDLLASALQLMAAQEKAQPADSEATVGWFAAATAAGPTRHGDLHMLLDLQSLTRTPQFRSYWIQRNVTDIRRLRAAVVDLYREPTQFREERVLLPMQAPPSADSQNQPDPASQTDLGPLEALVPTHIGVYRAIANPTPGAVLEVLDQKLLPGSPTMPASPTDTAPAEPTPSSTGTANDLDLRIDTPQLVPETPTAALTPLRQALDAAGVQSMLTLDRSGPPTPDLPFVAMHAAVVLRARTAWDAPTLTRALNAALRPRLTTGNLGLTWQPTPSAAGGYLALTGAQPLALFTEGPLAIFSNDPTLLTEILASRQRQPAPPTSPQPAQLIAGFNPTQERANFRRLTTQIAHANAATTTPSPDDAGQAVQLFRDNLPSLADTFADLASEHIVIRADGPILRQTVLYTWATPSTKEP